MVGSWTVITQAPGEFVVGVVKVTVFWSRLTSVVPTEPSNVVVAKVGVPVATKPKAEMTMAALKINLFMPPLSPVNSPKAGI